MNNKEISKVYEPKGVEDSVYKKWEESGFFNPDNLPASTRSSALLSRKRNESNRGEPGKREEAFTISMPPPNATGVLHIGHAEFITIQDLVIRFQRMLGKKALWLPGTDHASIATTTKMEKLLKQKENKSRHDLGREEFVRRVKEYVEKSRSTIRGQLKKMGSSCDWSRERYTLDDGLNLAVNTAFLEMYNDGLIYRGNRIVSWCPRCGSTLADDEVEYKEQKGKFYYIKYGPFVVATTRPETKIGDTAVAVNPADKRWQKYIGQELDVSLGKISVHVKVIADQSVDPKLGTGAVGVTPAHSLIDFEMAQKNNLPVIQVIGPDGKMTDSAGPYAGLSVEECRRQFVDDLTRAGLIEKIEEVDNNLSVCYRCEHVIEPLISKQWFIDVNKPVKKFGGKTIKDRALAAVKDGDIQIIPERFIKTYFHWLENLRDWCISRQIWFGHRIPVWYKTETGSNMEAVSFESKVLCEKLGLTDEKAFTKFTFELENKSSFKDKDIQWSSGKDGTITLYIGYVNLLKQKKLINDEWIEKNRLRKPLREAKIHVGVAPPTGIGWYQDPDTLDTWFSSGLWTFSTLGWPKKTKDLKTYHPTSLMETGYDILFFWVARMIIMSTYLMGEIPFKQVYLHGMVRDEKGRKMSKSLDNAIDPLDMIAKYGADATRLSLVIGNTPGNDLNISEQKIAGYRNFVNKLWNISRYILMKSEKVKLIEKQPKPKTLADKWILSELNSLIDFSTDNLQTYNFSLVGEKIYEFTWSKLADWYVEVSKITNDKDEILLYVLQNLLKLWHPFTPFATEVIWAKLNPSAMLLVQEWPKAKGKIDKKAIKDFELIQDIITAIRNLRAESKLAPAKQLKAIIVSAKNAGLIKAEAATIKHLARLEDVVVAAKGKKPDRSISAVISGAEIYLPVSGMIDIAKESQRLGQEAKWLSDFIIHLEEKLTNKKFTERAPKEIVRAERDKLISSKENLEKIKQQLKTLK